MSKKVLYPTLGCLAVVFMFLAASNVKQYNVSADGTPYQVTYCRGPQVAHWFSERCADALYPRLELLTLGLALFLICLYLAGSRHHNHTQTAHGSEDQQDDRGWKTCPDCAEAVRSTANVCMLCGFRFDAVEPAPPQEEPNDSAQEPDRPEPDLPVPAPREIDGPEPGLGDSFSG